jgi:hypothetical protein
VNNSPDDFILFTFTSALKKEAGDYSEISLTIYWTTRHHIPGDSKLHDIERENFRS